MPNPEDITDLTTTINMALALMAKAFKLNYSTPTNNNQRISSNPRNRQIAQPSMNMGQDKQMQMNVRNQVIQNTVQNPRIQNVVNQNGLIVVPSNANQNPNGNRNLVEARAEGNATGYNGNQIRCYNYRGLGHFARNCTVKPKRSDAAYLQTQLLIAQKEEAGIQLQAKKFDLMVTTADLDEIEEVDANCIFMANLQQASASGTQTDKAPLYDSNGSAEVHNYEDCYDNEILNMFTQEEQYTELLEPISEPHQVPHNDNNVISENYMQQPMPNPKDIIDPISTMNMALALMAKAFNLNYSTPTNNNQRISSNPKNRVQNIRNQNRLIGVQRNGNQNQNGNGNLVAARAEGNAAGQNGNQIRCYNCRGVGHYAMNCTEQCEGNNSFSTFLQSGLNLWVGSAGSTSCTKMIQTKLVTKAINHPSYGKSIPQQVLHNHISDGTTEYDSFHNPKLFASARFSFFIAMVFVIKPDISFLHVFGALCYPKNDRKDIGKLGAKGDIGFFICYSADSCAFRLYNRRTKKIMETINVTIDEHSIMDFEHRSSKPGLQSMNYGQISSGLDLTYAPSTITTQQPTEEAIRT
uniref:Integrase, catalytic region, zinc finger, CCHC-type, peptidase aspartic, catalytic n=1 Tax=Tanacetum cinerariifolium TaxID=118510 RepID=A0A6L2LGD0_TANCI|nr:integrase, catalytic region, zinc finger, CCHC-type, peptidase aspartic, catalytic [Tanacetum cinerariifolium]